MKTLTLSGIHNVFAISIAEDSITVKYDDEPKAPRANISFREPMPVTETVSEFLREAQKKSAKARCANETPEARKIRMSKLARARWDKRNSKSSAQVENEAAKEIIGSLFKIAKRNEETKNA